MTEELKPLTVEIEQGDVFVIERVAGSTEKYEYVNTNPAGQIRCGLLEVDGESQDKRCTFPEAEFEKMVREAQSFTILATEDRSLETTSGNLVI